MPGYVERIVAERKDLKERIIKLERSVVNYDFLQEIGEKKSKLLLAQVHAMHVYDFILYNRLLLEVADGNCTLDDITF